MKHATFAALALLAALPAAAEEKTNWADRKQNQIENRLDKWAHHIDDWFGTPDPDNPADANLRVMLDTEWNKHDDVSLTPRVRGRIKLPVLEQKLNVVFGDDSLDDDFRNDVSAYRNRTYPDGDTFHTRTSRDSNASLALRWHEAFAQAGVETDFDLGVRSGDDLYARAKAYKNWQLTDRTQTRLEQIYRYGLDSKHHVRTNWETRFQENDAVFSANHLHLQYDHDKTEEWTWGNSLYRQHKLGQHRHVNYGLHVSGGIEDKKADINRYGPFVGYRQPIWNDWLFAQTEVNYLNDRSKDRKHHVGTLLRLEALF